MAWRVNNIDLGALIPNGGVLGENRDPLLPFQVHGIHDAVGESGSFSEGTGLAKEGVDQRGLAVVNVGDHRHIPEVIST